MKNPNFNSETLNIAGPTTAQYDAWAAIEARPLVTMNVLEMIKPKNPSLELYWGNKGAGESLRYNQLILGGFVPAKPDELTNVPESMKKEGKVIYGDVIALLISKGKYQGALKHNMQSAFLRGERMRLKDEVAPQVKQNVVGRAPNEIARKISTFVPTVEEVEKISEAEAERKKGENLG